VTVTTFNSLRHLRRELCKTQGEMAGPDIADCSVSTIVSLEIGRLKLSPKLGWRISEACGIDYGWLMANDESRPMINLAGQPYSPEDFTQAQDKDLESLKFYQVEPEMEIGVAYDFLCRVLEAAKEQGVNAVSGFLHRLEAYVRSEVGHFTELQDAVFGEIRQWGKENVATGKSYPKSFLFPRSAEPFKRGQERFEKAIQAIAAREKRMARLPRRPPRVNLPLPASKREASKTIKK
jgi:hypothetical protein